MNIAARLTILIGILLIAGVVWGQDDPRVLSNGATRVNFVIDAPPQVFRVMTNANTSTTLVARGEPANFPFTVEVRDPAGNDVAQLSNLVASRLTLTANNRFYEITVTAGDASLAGVVILNVTGSRAPTPTFTRTPTRTPTLTPSPTATFTPTPLANSVICTVSTNARVNIRSAPSREAEVVGLLTNRTQIGANMLSTDGLWYGVVLLDNTQGWIYYEAIRQVTPCNFGTPTPSPTP